MILEQIQASTSPQKGPNFLDFATLQTKEKVALAMNKKLYWGIGDLQKRGAFESQASWDTFKESKECQKLLIPTIVKAYLISRGLQP